MALQIDVTANTNNNGVSSLSISSFSTSGTNEFLLAFIFCDSGVTVSSVTGGGLNWKYVQTISNVNGEIEIWCAVATAKLTNATLTANLSSGVGSSLFFSVTAFIGADISSPLAAIGAMNTDSQNSATPSLSLVTTRNNSWVWGAVSDQTAKDTPTMGANQTQQAIFLDNTFTLSKWIQSQNIPTPNKGTSVTINDTAPTGISYIMAIVEILPFFDKTIRVQGNAPQPIVTPTITNF